MSTDNPNPPDNSLGPLESAVMGVVWTAGKCSVHHVVALLPKRLAYTTVMTTMNRLFLKGLLLREKSGRQFLYWSRVSFVEWQRTMAKVLLADVLKAGRPDRLMSHLVEAIASQDLALLDELEAKIQERRRQSEP